MSDDLIREPRPRFEARPDDPQWLIDAVRFHGHLGPWAMLGLRIGQMALADLDCQGYFDVRIDVAGPIARPPARCILDGLQFATGATMGKDAITATVADQFEIRVTNTKTDQTIGYRPTEQFFETIAKMSGGQHVENLAREVARMPLAEIIVRETA
jgi:formylmethanofuran dehydrogenase subunit E